MIATNMQGNANGLIQVSSFETKIKGTAGRPGGSAHLVGSWLSSENTFPHTQQGPWRLRSEAFWSPCRKCTTARSFSSENKFYHNGSGVEVGSQLVSSGDLIYSNTGGQLVSAIAAARKPKTRHQHGKSNLPPHMGGRYSMKISTSKEQRNIVQQQARSQRTSVHFLDLF